MFFKSKSVFFVFATAGCLLSCSTAKSTSSAKATGLGWGDPQPSKTPAPGTTSTSATGLQGTTAASVQSLGTQNQGSSLNLAGWGGSTTAQSHTTAVPAAKPAPANTTTAGSCAPTPCDNSANGSYSCALLQAFCASNNCQSASYSSNFTNLTMGPDNSGNQIVVSGSLLPGTTLSQEMSDDNTATEVVLDQDNTVISSCSSSVN